MENFDISYNEATVTHSNKYNQNSGITFSFLFISNFFHDVVFKLDDYDQEFPTTFKNLNLPLYTGQKVTLVSINDNVIAYIDKSTDTFYYLTDNLQRDLAYGLKINWTVILVLTFSIYLLMTSLLEPGDRYTPLILLLPIAFRFYQKVSNYILKNKINSLVTTN